MFYDGLILFSVLFLASAIAIPVIGDNLNAANHPLFTLYLLTVGWLYFGWHWTHGGQTLGMRCWHVILLNEQLEPLDWKQASLRYVLALPSILIFAIGIIWSLFNKNNRSLHGLVTKTRLYYQHNN